MSGWGCCGPAIAIDTVSLVGNILELWQNLERLILPCAFEARSLPHCERIPLLDVEDDYGCSNVVYTPAVKRGRHEAVACLCHVAVLLELATYNVDGSLRENDVPNPVRGKNDELEILVGREGKLAERCGSCGQGE